MLTQRDCQRGLFIPSFEQIHEEMLRLASLGFQMSQQERHSSLASIYIDSNL